MEYDAFAAWIKACAADPALKNVPKPEKAPALAVKPAAVVRHARKDRMLASFETNVWSLRFRCMNCHTEGTPQNDKLRKENGDRVAWFKKAGPAATMDYLLGSKLISLADPEKSLLLTKPLGIVKHGGGIKFALGDQGYKAMSAVDHRCRRHQEWHLQQGRATPPSREVQAVRLGDLAQDRQDSGGLGRQVASGRCLCLGCQGTSLGEGAHRHDRPGGVGQGKAVAAHVDAAGGARLARVRSRGRTRHRFPPVAIW